MPDSIVLLGLGLLAGGVVAVAPLAAGLAVLLSMAVARRALRSGGAFLVLVGVAIGAWRGRASLARFQDARGAAREALGAPSRCEALALVVSSPAAARGTLRWDAELRQLRCEGGPIPRAPTARLYGGPERLARGDLVFVVADLAPVQLFHNEGLPDPSAAAARARVVLSGGVKDAHVVRAGSGIAALIDRARASVRTRIETTFAAAAAPMGRALVLGESDLDPADDEAFRISGLAHLLAVSGSHLVIVVVGAVAGIGGILRRVRLFAERFDVGRLSAAAGAVLAWVYADFAGGSGSALRAAAMLSVALAARALGRRPRGSRAFGVSLVLLASLDPLIAFDFSFLLSVAATAGLMLLQRPLAGLFQEWLPTYSRGVASAAATTLAATIPCAPLLAAIAPGLPAGGILANLLAVPLGELVALPVCLVHALLWWMPGAQRGAAMVASGSLLTVRFIAQTTANARWLSISVPPPTVWQNVILAVAVTALVAGHRRRRVSTLLVAVAALSLAELRALHVGAPRGVLRVTVLDVGQGDASLIDLPDRTAFLVDAGGLVGSPVDPGRAVVAPLLRARRRSLLRAAVLSHPHPDHFLGLSSALGGLEVSELWDTGQGEQEGAGAAYATLLAQLRARGVLIVRPGSLCGHPREWGGATVEILGPCPDFVPLANANDNSFVLRVALGDRAALLVGDAERSEEERLLASSVLHADFLKVGHHGSRTSSSAAFLRAVSPTEAAISCGVRNRFGHPHAATLETLSLAGVRVHRTDRDGSITWQTDGHRTAVFTAAGS